MSFFRFVGGERGRKAAQDWCAILRAHGIAANWKPYKWSGIWGGRTGTGHLVTIADGDFKRACILRKKMRAAKQGHPA